MTTIPFGYEVGAGSPVAIPLKHLAITGQTQEAGKTTALEGLITRSGLRAITFVTKRGEGSFAGGRRIDPYFREQADWQFVASILEASRGEKLRFERAWIIRASKGARTLADVQRNVRQAMEKAKGLSADVYLTLDAYLEAVVPTIARVRWAPRLALTAGVNVMDLSALPGEMQHLVIKSSLDWVLEHEADVVVVIPEAWKFIPQGRGTPVKLSAESYIRQGAGLRNYLWLDSQDLGGIDKQLLRSVAVWIIGVQREANEIKRTLQNIPATVAKPKPADVALLELGQFYACWGRHVVKTYAQPAWMNEDLAAKVARGVLDVRNASAMASGHNVMKAFREVFDGRVPEVTVTAEEAARLTRENETLKADNAELRRRLDALEKGAHDVRRRPESPDPAADLRGHAAPGARAGVPPTRGGAASDRDGHRSGRAFTPEETFNNEALYQAFKARLLEEAPAILKLLDSRPELLVQLERRTVTADGTSTLGRVARVLSAGFLDDSKRFSEILRELERTGTRVNNKSLSVALQELVVAGFLTKESVDRYRAVPDMKVRVEDR